MLANKIYHIHSETVNSAIKPESYDPIDGVSDRWVLPVQIRLLFTEQVEVVLASSFVIFPSASFAPFSPIRSI